MRIIPISFPRVRLGLFPTPFQEMKHLTKKLKGPRLFIKRDDLSGWLLGGNKARKLEFLIPDIIKKEADIVITTASVQSNWAAQLAAAVKSINIEVLLVLRGMKPRNLQGNYLLDRLLGAKIRFLNVPIDDYRQNINEIMEEIAEDYRKRGEKSYMLPGGGSTPLADLGWVNGAFELINQADEQDLRIDYVIVAGGSLGTASGLATGFKACNSNVKTICISISSNTKDECKSKIFLIPLINSISLLPKKISASGILTLPRPCSAVMTPPNLTVSLYISLFASLRFSLPFSTKSFIKSG